MRIPVTVVFLEENTPFDPLVFKQHIISKSTHMNNEDQLLVEEQYTFSLKNCFLES